MGGYGSGRKYGKRTTNNMWRLDVYYLHKQGLLESGRTSTMSWSRNGEKLASIDIRAEAGRIILQYHTRPQGGGEWEAKKYPVALEWTACHFGGQRPWFLCPCCDRRVAVLYGGSIYACRHCHDLAYSCQREQTHDRLLSRVQKVRDRLGWEKKHGSKPKGIHWRTFERLIREHDRCDAALWGAVAEKFGFDL